MKENLIIDLMRANLASLQTNSNTLIMRAIKIAKFLQVRAQKLEKSPLKFRDSQANSFAKAAARNLKNLKALKKGLEIHPAKNYYQ